MQSAFETASIVEGWTGPSEDRVEIIATPRCCVIVVADGAGGTSGGAAAAETVVREVKSAAVGSEDLRTAKDWCRLLAAVDRKLFDGAIGQSTAVIATVTARDVEGASVGDSEAWLIKPHACTVLTEQQRRKPLLGDGAATPVPFAAEFKAADTLLAGTDGLFKYSTHQRICEAALQPNLQHALRELVDSVRLRSGKLQDDVGLVICRPGDCIRAHENSIHHRQEIEASEACGCFYCLQTFSASQIRDWIDEVGEIGQTALCPKCGIDAVIGSASGYSITEELLAGMKGVWFDA